MIKQPGSPEEVITIRWFYLENISMLPLKRDVRCVPLHDIFRISDRPLVDIDAMKLTAGSLWANAGQRLSKIATGAAGEIQNS